MAVIDKQAELIAAEEALLQRLLVGDAIPEAVELSLSDECPYFPELLVPMTGEDGNAFFMTGRVRRELRLYGVPKEAQVLFFDNALADDYDWVLATIQRWVSIS